ncbi:MAG: hypothetical protein NC548_39285 [Lachnospiraceae bacterium]|nr:hypothetical protein [Lachnospiraceae bacterium]
MEGISEKVLANINEYFKENLPRYEVVKVRKKSYHPDDAHLYMVAAKKDDGAYAVWTNFNDRCRTLNYGHYDLKDLEACDAVMNEFYYSGN